MTERESLIQAARIARQMGFSVRASKDKRGRVSSYYIQRGTEPKIRLSDHEIPPNWARATAAGLSGGSFTGYSGPELLILGPRSSTWLRRAILLTEDGRDVPGEWK